MRRFPERRAVERAAACRQAELLPHVTSTPSPSAWRAFHADAPRAERRQRPGAVRRAGGRPGAACRWPRSSASAPGLAGPGLARWLHHQAATLPPVWQARSARAGFCARRPWRPAPGERGDRCRRPTPPPSTAWNSIPALRWIDVAQRRLVHGDGPAGPTARRRPRIHAFSTAYLEGTAATTPCAAGAAASTWSTGRWCATLVTGMTPLAEGAARRSTRLRWHWRQTVAAGATTPRLVLMPPAACRAQRQEPRHGNSCWRPLGAIRHPL